MTWKLFATDTLKSTIIETVIQNILMVVIEVIIGYFGKNFFFILWIAFLIIMFVLITIYPIFIAPLFNKFEPLDVSIPKEKELQERIEILCKELKFPLDKIFKIDGSKRSNHSQAYFFGFITKRIVIYDTLIAAQEVDQIEAVVLHELGHWYHGHMVQNVIAQMAQFGLIIFLFQFCLLSKGFKRAIGVRLPSKSLLFFFFG